jgi:predicted metal-dependent hydrolase
MQILINDNLVDVVIVRKNNKNIYLRFKPDKKLYVTCNRFVTIKDIEKLINNNMAKLTKMYLEATKNYNDDLFFGYLGQKYAIVYDENVKEVYMDNEFIYAKNQKELDKFYKNECLRIFTSEVERILPYFDNIPKFKLKLRKMTSRWGVNNRGNNTITLNTELLKKDIDLLDYVIIHELCHFYEANHSNRFWNHVSKYYPKYKEARKRLRG